MEGLRSPLVSSGSSSAAEVGDNSQVKITRSGQRTLLWRGSSDSGTTLYQSLQCGLLKMSAAKPLQAGWITQKRVGFYRLRGLLGTGNFSKVKFGVHLLTNGAFIVLVMWCSNCTPGHLSVAGKVTRPRVATRCCRVRLCDVITRGKPNLYAATFYEVVMPVLTAKIGAKCYYLCRNLAVAI